MIRRPPRSTRTDTLFPTRRSSDLLGRNHLVCQTDLVSACSSDFFGCLEIAVGLALANGAHYVGTDYRRDDAKFDLRRSERGRRRRDTNVACRRQTHAATHGRSEEHTSELQSLMRHSYAVFCLKKKNHNQHTIT